MQLNDRIKSTLFKNYLRYKNRPKKIMNMLAEMEFLYREEAPSMKKRTKELEKACSEGRFTAGAVQMRWKLVKDVREFCEDMYTWALNAAHHGVHLLVFPEDIGLMLLGLLPGIEDLAEKKINGSGEENPEIKELVGEVIKIMTPVTLQIYKTIFSRLARRFKMYIMGGSIMIAEKDGNIYNRAYLFGPEGELVGSQDKLHLLPLETSWGISPGKELHSFETPLARMALPVCMDATYFETFRILQQKGAEVVLLPTANPEDYNFWKALRGIWPRVQESKIIGIKSSMVGEFLGINFTGKAGIFVPGELTEMKDGIIVEAETFNQEELVFAGLDLNELKKLREEKKFDEINSDVIQKYLPELYTKS